MKYLKMFINWLRPRCPKCKGVVRYFGEDWTGRVWLSIYKCDNCETEYI